MYFPSGPWVIRTFSNPWLKETRTKSWRCFSISFETYKGLSRGMDECVSQWVPGQTGVILSYD